MEELGKVVNDLFAKGRRDLAAKRLARRDAQRGYLDGINRALKDVSRYVNDGDSEETVRRKTEQILGKYSRGKAGLLARFAGWYGAANIRRVARILDNGRDGVNTLLLYWKKNEAFNRRERGKMRRQAAVLSALEQNQVTLKELVSTAVTLEDYWAESYTGNPDLFTRPREGRSQSFTVDELLYLRAADQDDDSRKAVIYGNMVDPAEREDYRRQLEAAEGAEAIVAIQEKFMKLGDSRWEQLMEEADRFFAANPKYLAVADAIARDYRDNYERLNRMSIEEFNKPVWRVDHYVPLLRKEASGDTLACRTAQDFLGVSSTSFSQWVEKGVLMKRINIGPVNQTPVELGLYKTWAEQLDRTEHLIAYGGLVRTLNAVYKAPRSSSAMRNTMRNRYGKDMVSYIDEYLNELANPHPQSQMSELDKRVRNLRGRTATAYLAWKASGVIKQLITSPAPFFQYMHVGEYGAAALEMTAHFKELSDFIKGKSAYMAVRSFDPMLDLIREAADKTENPVMAAIDRFNKLGMKGLEFADWACVAPGWLVVYRRELARIGREVETERAALLEKYRGPEYADTLTADEALARADREVLNEAEIDEKAVALADDVVRLTQPSNQTDDLAPLFKNRGKGGETAKLLLQFQTALNVIYQNIRYDMPQMVRDGQWDRLVGGVMGYVVAGIALGMVTQWFGGDDEEDKKIPQKLMYWGASQFVDSLPLIGGTVSDKLQQALTGEGGYRTGSLLPVLDKASAAVFGLPRAIGATASGDAGTIKAEWARWALNTGEAFGYAFGVPVSGVKEDLRVFGIGDKDGALGFRPGALLGRRYQ